MDALLQELTGGITSSDMVIRMVVRMLLAALCGAIIGSQRRRTGHSAGLRTHMLVALGAAVFVLVGVEGGMSKADFSRIIQGIAAGVGFLGAGAILKAESAHQIKGLTTAADIWVMAGIGTAIGAGLHWMALSATVLMWFILGVLYQVEERMMADEEIGRLENRPRPPTDADRPSS